MELMVYCAWQNKNFTGSLLETHAVGPFRVDIDPPNQDFQGFIKTKLSSMRWH